MYRKQEKKIKFKRLKLKEKLKQHSVVLENKIIRNVYGEFPRTIQQYFYYSYYL